MQQDKPKKKGFHFLAKSSSHSAEEFHRAYKQVPGHCCLY